MRPFVLIVLMLALVQAPARAFDLTVVHLSDTHSHLDPSPQTIFSGKEKTFALAGGWPRLATALKAVRASRDNVALLHAGDAVQGGLYFMQYHGRPEMECMNRLGFDAMTLGNHEFDNGPDFLARMLRWADFPVLGANVDASAAPALAGRLRPYVILEYGPDTNGKTERVGVIGILTRHTDILSQPGDAIRFGDEIETAAGYVRELEAEGIDKIILLTHEGLEKDMRLAAQVPGVDLVVGGHSHSLLADPEAMAALGKRVDGPYPVQVRGADGQPVYVVTAWKWGLVFPVLDLSFDDAGRITRVQGSAPLLLADTFRRKDADGRKTEVRSAERKALLAELAASPAAMTAAPDPAEDAFLKPYRQGLAAMRGEVIGNASAPLPHVREPNADMPRGSLLAPHVCASMLRRMEHTGSPADVALLNAGGLRDGLAEGDVTLGRAHELMPFDNTLYLLPVTGGQLLQALEYGLEKSDGAFPYVGGARYKADMNRPAGSRVTSADVLENGQWQPLEPDRKYRLAINAFLANSGDGYAVLKSLASPEHDTGFTDSQAFIDYVKAMGTLAPPESTGVTLTLQK